MQIKTTKFDQHETIKSWCSSNSITSDIIYSFNPFKLYLVIALRSVFNWGIEELCVILKNIYFWQFLKPFMLLRKFYILLSRLNIYRCKKLTFFFFRKVYFKMLVLTVTCNQLLFKLPLIYIYIVLKMLKET